ncbi:hypothetical protein PIB30_103753 [Stylosanthes scabra]|uniref:Uncharacterized protein n=1 Tax=Stylosanthes scabra TaxID=79078 RepID=A0ABU6TXQ3_9FABA|nr:hypothetical protein [Stylosanthes scabra]
MNDSNSVVVRRHGDGRRAHWRRHHEARRRLPSPFASLSSTHTQTTRPLSLSFSMVTVELRRRNGSNPSCSGGGAPFLELSLSSKDTHNSALSSSSDPTATAAVGALKLAGAGHFVKLGCYKGSLNGVRVRWFRLWWRWKVGWLWKGWLPLEKRLGLTVILKIVVVPLPLITSPTEIRVVSLARVESVRVRITVKWPRLVTQVVHLLS